MLTDIDDADGALKTTREAVDILRKLVERGPEAFLPDLAIGLHNLGLILSGAGNREGALRALDEAVAIRRRLMEQSPHVQLEVERSLEALATIQREA